jgi:hypothetical protein
MPAQRSELPQGTLDLLILKSLARDELHGMGIARRIAQITDWVFEVRAGSLFPALRWMGKPAGSDLPGRIRNQPTRQVVSPDQDRHSFTLSWNDGSESPSR